MAQTSKKWPRKKREAQQSPWLTGFGESAQLICLKEKMAQTAKNLAQTAQIPAQWATF